MTSSRPCRLNRTSIADEKRRRVAEPNRRCPIAGEPRATPPALEPDDRSPSGPPRHWRVLAGRRPGAIVIPTTSATPTTVRRFSTIPSPRYRSSGQQMPRCAPYRHDATLPPRTVKSRSPRSADRPARERRGLPPVSGRRIRERAQGPDALGRQSSRAGRVASRGSYGPDLRHAPHQAGPRVRQLEIIGCDTRRWIQSLRRAP